jgi:hypothetical protein
MGRMVKAPLIAVRFLWWRTTKAGDCRAFWMVAHSKG